MTGVSACTSDVPAGAKPTKQLPDGLIISAHHISNEFYSQVTGRYNPSAYGLSPQDYGTQWDDSLRSQGGVLPDSGCAGYQQYLEYFGNGEFCIRCCNFAFSYYCDPSQDTRGCRAGIPGDYNTPGFTNNGLPVIAGSSPSLFGSAPYPRPYYVPDWAQCAPATDTCISSSFTCCQSPEDALIGNGKTTCRAPGYCASTPGPNPFSGAQSGPGPSGSSNNVASWNDCTPGISACPSGYMCCVAPSDVSTSKHTCRLSGLAANDPSGCYVSTSTPTPSTASDPTGQKCGYDNNNWRCGSASASCCSQYGWCGNTAAHCGAGNQVPYNFVASTPSSSTSSVAPSPTPGKLVNDWNDCNPQSDSCNSGFTCCVAPADVGSGKTTCRAGGYCASGVAPPGLLVIADWNDCRIGTDRCSSTSYSCCVAPVDVVSGKSTCRAPGFCS